MDIHKTVYILKLILSTRKTGFEPIITVLKTVVLPLNYSLFAIARLTCA